MVSLRNSYANANGTMTLFSIQRKLGNRHHVSFKNILDRFELPDVAISVVSSSVVEM